MSQLQDAVTIEESVTDSWFLGNAETREDFPKYIQSYKEENLTSIPSLELSENSTEKPEIPEELYTQIASLFDAAKEEYFEDGIESEFERNLVAIVKNYGQIVVNELAYLILNQKVSNEVASEALRCLGSLYHSVTYKFRLWLLEASLLSPSAMVRDGAILGLASLDDRHALPYLKRVIAQELCEELRRNMEQVLDQLEQAD